jgi:hypothetical protein
VFGAASRGSPAWSPPMHRRLPGRRRGQGELHITDTDGTSTTTFRQYLGTKREELGQGEGPELKIQRER